jgi:hypothetical protein
VPDPEPQRAHNYFLHFTGSGVDLATFKSEIKPAIVDLRPKIKWSRSSRASDHPWWIQQDWGMGWRSTQRRPPTITIRAPLQLALCDRAKCCQVSLELSLLL